MADTERSGAPGPRPGAGTTACGRPANEVAGAVRSEAGTAQHAGRVAAEATEQARERGAEAVRESADATPHIGEAAERGGEVTTETGRQSMQGIAARQSRFVQGATEEMDKTGRGLADMIGEATAGMRSLIGPPDLNASNPQQAQEAVSKLVQAVMDTNLRFADELLRRTGPSAVVDLQRRFLREYFDALAQGGTLLLGAARQAADGSPRPLEQKMQGRGGDASLAEGGGGKVADVMSRDVALASPDDTVQQAAKRMSEQDTGALPVGEDGRLVGMVTDRDLAVRALAAGKDPSKTKLREVMSGEPRYVFEDEPMERAAAVMAEQQAKRVPVLNRDKRLVGIVSLGDLARRGGAAGEVLEGVSRPGGPHRT